MTPYEIGILLHYHCRTDDSDELHRGAPIWPTTRDWFLSEGLLRECQAPDKMYEITERGRCYVSYGLLQVPLPEWHIPTEAALRDQLSAANLRINELERAAFVGKV